MNSSLLIIKLLDTSIEVWGAVYFKTIKPQVTVQKSLRIIFLKAKVGHAASLLKDFKILPLKYLYIFVSSVCNFIDTT